MRAFVLAAGAVMLLPFILSVPDAFAACSYRTQTPSGTIYSGTAGENAVACIVATDRSCPRCRPGFQHICIGGNWVPLPSPCGKQMTTGVPQLPHGTEERHVPFEQMPAPNRSSRRDCIYYDRDGRRIDLPPEDLVWAEETGLVAKKICP